jgi:hypothetical protein
MGSLPTALFRSRSALKPNPWQHTCLTSRQDLFIQPKRKFSDFLFEPGVALIIGGFLLRTLEVERTNRELEEENREHAAKQKEFLAELRRIKDMDLSSVIQKTPLSSKVEEKRNLSSLDESSEKAKLTIPEKVCDFLWGKGALKEMRNR